MRGRARQLRGAFRQTRVPAAAQKFAGCFQINFEGTGVLAFLPATSSSADRLPPALLGSFLRASETRRTILAGRSVEEASKQLSVDGALRGFWDWGKPGRGSLVGTRLRGGFGGAPEPAAGKARVRCSGTPGIGRAGRRLSRAARSWRGPGGGAAETAAAGRRRLSDPGSASGCRAVAARGKSPEFAAGCFGALRWGPGVRSRGEGWSGRSPAAGGPEEVSFQSLFFCYAN